MEKWNVETLKELVEKEIIALQRIVEGNDRRYEQKFNSQEQAVGKAEAAQSQYNIGHNDLLRKMEGNITKTEYDAGLKATDEKIQNLRVNDEKRMDRMEADLRILRESKSNIEGRGSDDVLKSLAVDIRSLRDSRGTSEGVDSGMKSLWGYIIGVAGIIFAIFMYFSTHK